MRKLILLLGVILSLSLTSLSASTNQGHYSIKCYKCKEYSEKKGYISTCSGCLAWRMYGEEKGDGWMVYHCSHGHKLLVSSKSEEKR